MRARGLRSPVVLGSEHLCWSLGPLPHAVKHLLYQLTQGATGTGHGLNWALGDYAPLSKLRLSPCTLLSQGLPA